MAHAKPGAYRDAYRKLPNYQKATIFFVGVALIVANIAVQVIPVMRGHPPHIGMWVVIGHVVTLGIGVLCLMPERLFALLEHIPLPGKWHRDGGGDADG